MLLTKLTLNSNKYILTRWIWRWKLFAKYCTSEFRNEYTMAKVLNVAEKNDAAKNIAHIMSKGSCQRREGISKFNKIYDYEYMLRNQRVKMVMTSVSGHLLNFDFSGSYRGWKFCNPEKLFEVPVFKNCPDGYLNIKKTLEREVRGAQKLIIWTDGDREGENIGFEIIKVCKDVNPNLQVMRAKFSEITFQSITRAAENLCQPDARTNDAVDVRQELDLRIGASFTRFLTMRLRNVFPDKLSDRLISYGSCQFPTLGFVVERYKQVMSFIPENFWKIKVTHKQEDSIIEFSWKRGRLFCQPACFIIFEKCLENPEATVTNVRCKKKSKWRPLPLDTVELEKLVSKKLKINVKETMKIAEKLYTSGLISYPRTETNMFPKELNLNNLVEIQTVSPDWGDFASQVLNDGPNPRQGSKSDNAHPPIHPTKFSKSLHGDEKRIYDFIVRHFLACCSKDAQGQETVIDIEISEEEFSANGLMITERNYLDVYPYEKWNAKVIPVYSLGQKFTPTQIEMPEGETSPPNLLTEADLISLMEKHGIGTDATHADHIETIKSRMYVGVRDDGRFVPGELGMGLVDGYDLMGFEMSKPYLRAELEADLKRICEGTKDPKVVLNEQIQKYKAVFLQSVEQATKLDEALSKYLGAPNDISTGTYGISQPQIVRSCMRCNADMALKKKKDGSGFYIGCLAYPQCSASMWLPSYVKDVTVSDTVCSECNPGPIRKLNFKFKPGTMKPYYPNEYCGCIGGCDMLLLQSLGLADSSQRIDASENLSSNFNQTRSYSTDSGYSSHMSRSNDSSLNNSNRSSSNNVFSTARSLSNSTRNQHQQNNSNQHSFQSNFPSTSTVQNLNRNSSRKSQQIDRMRRPTDNAASSSNNDTPTLACTCGNDAIILTVRKAGKNNGRQFYKCGNLSGDGCSFFQWLDYQESDAPSFTSDNQINCECRQLAVIKITQKEGVNKGRKFYSCSKQPNRKCRFFKWVDENSFQGNSSNSNYPKKRKKCSLCRQEGHTRKNCPST